jgi:cell division protein FtsB
MHDSEFQDRVNLPLRFAEEEAAPRRNPWRVPSLIMEVVIFALILVAIARWFQPEMSRRDEMAFQEKRLEQVMQDKESAVIRLRQEHRLLKTDKEYLETIARDRLDLQHPDEYIVRLEE